MPQVIAAAQVAYTAAVNFVAGIPGLVTIAGEGGAVLIGQQTVNFVALTAVSFGVNAAARQGIPDAEFSGSNRKQAIPDRLSGYGRARIGGAYMLWEAQGSYAYNVLALHDGQVDGFEQIYLNDDIVTVSGGYVQTGADGRYGVNSDLVQIDTRVGLPTETRYSQIPDTTIWPEDARGDGIASLMMIAKSSSQEKYLRDFPNGLPLPSAVTRMQICYDARLGERDDPLAWVWTQNPVWQLLDYMTNPQTGMRLEYEQYFAPKIAMWIAAADVCDEPVPLAAGGTIPRYTGDGTYLHSTPPADVMGTILACMDGWIAQDSGGVFVIEAGVYSEPTVTITDAHIVGMDRQFYLEDERAVNELVISYTSPAYDYTEVEALPWRDETDILDRNGSVRSQRMSLPWVSTNSQARRLAKIAMARATSPIRGTITTDLYGLKAFGQRRVRIQAPADSVVMADIVVDVVSVTLNADFTVTIPFVASSAQSYEWDAATEENSQPIIPRPDPTDIDTPMLLSAVYDAGNNRIEVTVQGPVDPAYEYQLAWNAQDGDPPQQIEYPVAVSSGSNWIVYTTPTVPTGELIDVQVAFITSNGAVGEYSNTLTVSTAATGLYGSLVAMEDNDTVSASGVLAANIVGDLDSVEDDDTVSGAGSVGGITGSATITEDDDTVSSAATVGGINGSLTATEADDSVTGAGEALVSISYVASGAEGEGTSNPSIPYPASGILAGDLLILQIVSRDSGTNVPTPSGWTAIAANTGGSGVDGLRSGSVRLETFYREATGSESGSVSVTIATTAYTGMIRQYRKNRGTWSVSSTTGVDSSAGSAWSATGSSWSVSANDTIICVMGWNAELGSVNSPALSMSGLSGSPVSLVNSDRNVTSNGNRAGINSADCILAGASTAAPTYTATMGSTGTDYPAGVTHFIRLRAS